jgi:hypothetical protein
MQNKKKRKIKEKSHEFSPVPPVADDDVPFRPR